MLEKLSFYDLLAHIVPGGTVVALAYWLLWSKVIDLKLPTLPTGITLAALLLVVSYLGGHLVQGFAELLEHRLIVPIWRLWDRPAARQFDRPGPPQYSAHGAGAFFANQLLSESRHRYPQPIVELIRMRATAAGFPGTRHPHLVSPKQLFDLCQASMLGSDAAERAGIYLAISGLSRGMIAASVIGVLAAITVALHNGKGPIDDPTVGIVLAFFLATGWIWYRRFRRFSWYFADEVWTGFATLKPKD